MIGSQDRYSGLGALLLITLALGLNPARAERIHALVIGIDAYKTQGGELADLQGAVNDARDIAAALREIGATEVRLLLNRDAHRDAILNAWDALRANARPGDTLLLSYAGHGSREPERIAGSEADGMDEVTVLGGFRTSAPDNYQRIFDDEWRERVAAAEDYNVVLVFDTCHSGTLNRQLMLPGRGPRTRFAQYGAISQDSVPLPDHATETTPGTLPHETYLAASLDNQRTIEIEIDGRPRGALSYLFARALRGYGDFDGDGVLSRGELRGYIQENVRMRTERRQEATVAYTAADDSPLFRYPGARPAPAPAVPSGTLGLALTDAEGLDPQAVFAQLHHVVPAQPEQAELVWQVAGGRVVSRFGDVVARVALGQVIPDRELQGVIDKWRVLPALKTLAERRPLALRIRQGDGLHRRGQEITLVVEPRREPYLTLVNLPSTGEVQYLYPDERYGDAPRVDPSQPYELETRVTAPFGGDHLIVLASRRQPVALQRELQALNGQRAAEAVFELLDAALAESGNGHEMGILSFYTAP